MELSVKNIVTFRNGGTGVVVGWGRKPAYVVGARFTNPIGRWDENGRFGKKPEPSPYDIVTVHDGSAIDEPVKAFRASCKIEELPLIWEETVEKKTKKSKKQ